MSKLETVRALNDSGPQLETVRTVAELQRQIADLQPQRQIAESLSCLQQGLESLTSRHLDDLASRIEPLAQAMAALTAETRETLVRLQAEASKQQQAKAALMEETRSVLRGIQAEASSYQQATAAQWQTSAESWESALGEIRTERERLGDATERAERAAQTLRGWTWRAWAFAGLIGALSGLATAASWNYLGPRFQILLDTQAVAEHLRPILTEPTPLLTPPSRAATKPKGSAKKQP